MQSTDQSKQIYNKDLVLHVKQKLKDNKITGPVWIGYSGGCDSHVLIDIIAKILPKKDIFALHVNHNISSSAKEWESHCQNTSISYGIKFSSHETYPLHEKGSSLEDKARKCRFNVFCSEVQINGTLLLAHHLDDQVETILMRMFKGAGPTGISGINEYYKYKNINILRPLLEIPKQEIKNYAKINNLHWIEDTSNNDCKYDRNHIRNIVIPNLTAKWPAAKNNIIRTAKHCNEQNIYMQRQCRIILAEIADKRSLNIELLAQHDELLQKLIIRNWLHINELVTPSTKQIEIIFSEIIKARQDKKPEIKINSIFIRRYKNKLYIVNLPHNSYPKDYKEKWLKTEQNISLPLLGIKLSRNNNIKKESILYNDLTIQFRQGGERLQPNSRTGSHPLKKLMQEWEIPTWERDKTPLLYFKNELVCVPGYAIAKKYLIDGSRRDDISLEKV